MSFGPACPLCGGTGPKVFVREARGHRLWDCRDCGTGFCDPFQNPGPAYYERNADLYSSTARAETDPMSFEYDEALALLRRARAPGARLLDVGCGDGGFLHRAKAEGWAPSGLDFNPARAKALRERGFEIFDGALPELAARAPAAFDALTIFQVLEHLDAPNDWLRAASSLLKPGGLLVVGVPNRDRTFDPFQGPGLDVIDDPPHHLTRWSAPALSGLLARAGFRTLECRPLGYPLPLLRLMLRNTLRLGLATRALGVEQVRHASTAAAKGRPSSRQRLIRSLVSAKEAVLDAATGAVYPLFQAACRARGWQGAVLFAAAKKPG
ncbi:MAG: class I SAM-dependent methyltransferase [Elusimicrobia bacterium]|nr:class I SAM-dependent methyltransferase [Elusimicrobiota bacterium]